MDPISQASLGAALAQSGSNKEKVKSATLLGCFAGLFPDLDVLIISPTDPLLFLEFHRQFTHSLLFIPVGALIVALALHRFFGKGLTFKESYLFCLLGIATHGVLDACTTYGTQLLWPFTDLRVAWNTISIIDPIFTFPILGLLLVGVWRKQPWFARAAILWGVAYMSIGLIQRDRAEEAGWALAESREHAPMRLEAKPGFANLLLWKIVYETEDTFYVDAIRVGSEQRIFDGDSAEKLNLNIHYPWLDPSSQQATDIERFRWFSNDYLAVDPNVTNRIIDVRYSVVPNEIDALWATDLDPNKDAEDHVEWISLRRSDASQTERWWKMLTD